MSKEYYCSYEQAVKLKELGFDWKCTHYYECGELTSQYEDVSGDGGYADYTISIEDLTYSANKNCPNTDVFDAPRLDQAQAWLREVNHIYVYPETNCLKKWFAKAVDMESNEDLIWDGIMFDSYESALSAGIDKALELLTDKQN